MLCVAGHWCPAQSSQGILQSSCPSPVLWPRRRRHVVRLAVSVLVLLQLRVPSAFVQVAVLSHRGWDSSDLETEFLSQSVFKSDSSFNL